MNASVIRPVTPPPPRDRVDGAFSIVGTARHVSAEGCQFMIRGARPVVGERLGFAWHGEPIGGTVRWVLEDRIGFAFARRLDPSICLKLAGQSVALEALNPKASRQVG